VIASPSAVPAFGEAGLSNCEREQIHLSASIQPHGAPLVVREFDFTMIQASANAADFLGLDDDVLGKRLDVFAGNLASCPRSAVIATASFTLDAPRFAGLVAVAGGLMATHVSQTPGEYLVWFRPEQVRTVTWAGNPFKPVLIGENPATCRSRAPAKRGPRPT